MDYRILIKNKNMKNQKSVMILILSLSLTIICRAQVFVPFSHWTERNNCSTGYCPTLNVSAASLLGTAGMTQIVSTCIDDNSILVQFPFDFFLNQTAFTNWYIGSNTYITAGAGSAVYSGLSASVPALPKFHIGAGDGNYQAVYKISGTNYIRMRVEGNSAYGTCSVNTIYEITFYRPTVNYQYVQIVFGAHGRTNGQFGVANASTYYASNPTLTINSSYVFYSTNGGINWTILPNYSITGVGTTL
jgi:hypothetical protein